MKKSLESLESLTATNWRYYPELNEALRETDYSDINERVQEAIIVDRRMATCGIDYSIKIIDHYLASIILGKIDINS